MDCDVDRIESKLNKLRAMKPKLPEKYKYMIKSDLLDDLTKSFNIQALKLIEDPIVFYENFERLNNNIDNYIDNKILFGNISIVIENAHRNTIYDMKMNIRENHLISCSYDSSIKVWDLNNNTLLRVIEKAHDGKDILALLLLSLNNEEILLSGGKDSKIRFWDSKYNEIYCINNGSWVNHLIHSNSVLIVGDQNKTINFYEINSKLLINKLTTDHIEFVWRLLFLKSSDILLTGSADSTIKVWNIKNYSIQDTLKENICIYTIREHKDPISALIQLKYDTNIIVSGDEDGTIIFHSIYNDDEMNYKVIKKYEISYYDNNPNDEQHDMFLSELLQHKMLVSITSYSSLLFWNLSNFEIIRNVKIKSWIFTLITVENDERMLFSKLNKGISDIIIWN